MIRWTSKYGGRLALALVFLIGLSGPALAQRAPASGSPAKLDVVLKGRVDKPGSSRVIVMLRPGSDISAEVRKAGGKAGRKLSLIHGHAVELPNAALKRMADHPLVVSIHSDRPTGGQLNRVGVTVGSRAVQQEMGYDGAGVGVAVVDSGITSWHDDLTYSGASPVVRTANGQRVAAFVDFVQGRSSAYDDHGHGTHVSGIIAGNGYDSRGARAGIAPAAHLVGLKVLDQQGRGRISDVIAALGWIVENRTAFNIRVANLSVGAAVTESYNTDPLTLAAKQAVEAGVVVVTAAGNLGKNSLGQVQYGGITAPGNAPWVLTVGASSTEGTPTRVDDKIALYSSRGPTAIDHAAKPDLVAPGSGVASLSDPSSTLYSTKSGYLLKGTVATSYKPYLSLSGTSMSSPVVAGTVALMLQANPNLTPNMVKAILQYTAQKYNYDALTQGAGFLNAKGATQLAQFFATAQPGSTLPIPRVWSKQVIWGSHQIDGGVIRPNTNAWALDTVWGSFLDAHGENIVWGTLFDSFGENIVWGSFDLLAGENIVWGTLFDSFGENIVWGTFLDGFNIVWGTFMDENVVWGSTCGGTDCENMVWGSFLSFDFNIVWGTFLDGFNIVWGSSGVVDGSVWGTSSEADNVTWGNSGEDTPLFDDPESEPAVFDAQFEELFENGVNDTTATTASDTAVTEASAPATVDGSSASVTETLPVSITDASSTTVTETLTPTATDTSSITVTEPASPSTETESSTLSTTTSVTQTVTGILGGGL